MTDIDLVNVTGNHDFGLVILSVGIAIIAAYTALNLAVQIKAAQRWQMMLWLIGGALALGIGIWSMHFVGMLAYHLPIAVTYDFPLVAVSIALAIVASGVVLFLVSRAKLSVAMLISGSVLMGLGIAAMHYTGMSAMQVDATPLYDWKIVAFSGVVAIGGSLTALWLGFQTHTIAFESSIRKLASAVVMGLAIAGMHYTAIAAVKFQLNTKVVNAVTHNIDNRMAVTIGIATLILLALAVVAALVAQRLTVENARIEALRQSTNRFRCLEQNSSDVIQAVSAEGIVTYTSSSIQRILGYAPDEWQGKQATALVYQDDIHHIQNLLNAAMSHPATNIVAELRLDCADGTTKDCEAIACNLLAEPSVTGIVITYRDITKRKQTESALWNALQRLTFHVENSPLAAIEWNRNFRVARWSREAELLFGWQAVEVLGKLPSEWEFIVFEDRDAVSQVIEQLINGNHQRNVSQNRNYTKDGKIVYCEWYNSGLLDEAGNLVSVMSLILDVTVQKQAEAELLTRAAELAQLTAVLTQTNRALQKRNQELDEFTYIVSHDLKAPLRAIANLSEWIEEDLDTNLTDETRQQMDLLRQRVYRLEALIDGLLQYSRVGRFDTPPTAVSVGKLLAETIDSLAPPETFVIHIAADLPSLVTHHLLLTQVFSNLISNAIKHHPRSDGKLHISVKDLGADYEFAVADDGDGIAPAYHAKIFGIFQTLSARDRRENTGIGLAIVKKIVESQGGSVRVESQAGQGSTFYFTWLKVQE